MRKLNKKRVDKKISHVSEEMRINMRFCILIVFFFMAIYMILDINFFVLIAIELVGVVCLWGLFDTYKLIKKFKEIIKLLTSKVSELEKKL